MGSLEELLGTTPTGAKTKIVKKQPNLADALGLSPGKAVSKPKPEIDPEPSSTNLINAAEFHVKNQPENFKEEQVRILKENLDILQNSFDDKVLIGKALYTVVALLREHTFLKDNITENNMSDMVKTLRSTYATVVMAKKTKAGKVTKKTAKQNEISALVGDMDLKDFQVT